MKKLALVLTIMLCVCVVACAESQMAPLDYVLSSGYTIAAEDESPGWPACFMLESPSFQEIIFSDTEKSYAVAAMPMLDINFDPNEMRMLFYELLSLYDWDVSCYNPDCENTDVYAASYGIEEDLDVTELNFMNKTEYLQHLVDVMQLDVETQTTENAIQTDTQYKFGFISYSFPDGWDIVVDGEAKVYNANLLVTKTDSKVAVIVDYIDLGSYDAALLYKLFTEKLFADDLDSAEIEIIDWYGLPAAIVNGEESYKTEYVFMVYNDGQIAVYDYTRSTGTAEEIEEEFMQLLSAIKPI